MYELKVSEVNGKVIVSCRSESLDVLDKILELYRDDNHSVQVLRIIEEPLLIKVGRNEYRDLSSER